MVCLIMIVLLFGSNCYAYVVTVIIKPIKIRLTYNKLK